MSRIRMIALPVLLALSVGLLAGCDGSTTAEVPAAPKASQSASEAAPADPNLHVGTYKVTGSETVVVTTSKGAFTIELYKDKAPNTVSSFLELVDSKFYDGIRVHRVVAGFVMQVGDPQTKGLTAKQVVGIVGRQQTGPLASDPQLGAGGPGWMMKAEFNDLSHDRGVVAMARSKAEDSAGSQFYVTLAPAKSLDGQYTVFGRVVKGMEVVDKLAVGDIITSAKIFTGN
jgi:peptidyl-prolyl cis-trans isomerase B (cyclophilin B)